MNRLTCRGLPADWLNAWLAAIGCTVLVPDLLLSWSDDPIPVAQLSTDRPEFDIEEELTRAFPSVDQLDGTPIARDYAGLPRIGLNLSLEDFSARAALARASDHHGWTLSSLYTDLLWDRKANCPTVDKGPFLTPMPGADNTMHDRIRKLVAAVAEGDVDRSLRGLGKRVQQTGIGFDAGRIGSLADDTKMWVDPVIDVLAFVGVSLFPVRGEGTSGTRQRGWGDRRTGVGCFRWAAWSTPLDVDGIDALLDELYRPTPLKRHFRQQWELVPFQERGSNDVTRGFASRPRS